MSKVLQNVLCLFAGALIFGVIGCGTERPLGYLENVTDSDTGTSDGDTDTDSDTLTPCDAWLEGSFAESSTVISRVLGPGENNVEIGVDIDEPSVFITTGPDDVWKLVREASPKITVEVSNFTPSTDGCVLVVYLYECAEDSTVECEFEDALCLGAGVSSAANYSGIGLASLSYSNTEQPDADVWLFFDTAEGCGGTYEFTVTYGEPLLDGGL